LSKPSIHAKTVPSEFREGAYLYTNGMIKDNEMDEMRKKRKEIKDDSYQ
jgi:hypothetical protein